MKLLEVKHVHKCYANTRRVSEVLHDLSFAAEEGSFTAIMGKSGSGKSTLFVMRRYMAPQRDVYARLASERLPWMSDFIRHHASPCYTGVDFVKTAPKAIGNILHAGGYAGVSVWRVISFW